MLTKENKFCINEETNKNGLEITLKNEAGSVFVTILPESGARIKELCLSNGKESFSIVKKITDVHSEQRDDLFMNAKLSPFAGRIKDGEFSFNSSDYNLEINYSDENHACHGFVYDKKFAVTDYTLTEDFISCTLEYRYPGDVPGYPLSFVLAITYKLSLSEGLTCETQIKNISDMPMPLSDGWHFYFDLDMNINDLILSIESCEIIELDSRMIPTGEKKLFTEFTAPKLIGNRKFDTCFKLKSDGKAVTRLYSEKKKIDVRIWQESNPGKYQYLLIYTPPDRRSIAIEPMTSNIDSFNNGEGLITLAPNESFKARFGVMLNQIF